MRELTADTIIRVRAPRPEPRKRELTGDTRIRLSQIVDLKDWALEMAQDEAAPEGAVHHWSDGDHVKKNGKWVPVINNKKEVTRTLSAESRSTPTQASSEAPNVKTATKTQERKLKRFSCTVDVSKIDTKAVKIIDKTISSMIRDYKMRPLDHINMDSKNPQKWAYSDGEGITLNETFFNNPDKHYKEMQEKMELAKNHLKVINNIYSHIKNPDREANLILEKAKRFTVRGHVLYKGQEVECVTLHEMAHVLCQQKMHLFNVDKTSEEKIKNRLIFDTYYKAIETGDINKISYYARRNRKEFYAEAFVMYKLGKEQLPAYIVKMIEEVM
ncbi:MAG: hypothetical protein J6S81_03815 [Treponema sp.]|nr:hypothetical protein [Treponema sp.]